MKNLQQCRECGVLGEQLGGVCENCGFSENAARRIKADYKKFAELFIKTCNEGNQDNPNVIVALDINDGDIDIRSQEQIYNNWVELANFRGIENNNIDEYDVNNWFDSAFEERKSTELSEWLCEEIIFEFMK